MAGREARVARKTPRLPACRSCHQRKVKCDNNRPKCAPCTRNGTLCMLIFPGNEHEAVSREELYALEQQDSALSSGGEADEERSPGPPSPVHKTARRANVNAAETPLEGSGQTPASTTAPGPLRERVWRKSQAHLLQTLGRTAKAAEAAEAQVEANAMPSAKDVHYLFDKYLMGSHVQNPFLLQHEIEQLYGRVFGDGATADRAAPRDLFRTFMILAIATIVPYRLGQHPHHPLGYYLAAMPHLGGDFLAPKLESVQDLLLISRFGIFYHIGTSIWDTIQLCGRLCIELGLHRPRETPAPTMLQEQIERRVFWEYYMLDRYSSTTISRPFALADGDISVPLLADADDEDIRTAVASGTATDLDAFCRTHIPRGPTEMSVFLLCVRLRQISSRIQTEFSRLVSGSGPAPPPPFLLTGRIFALLDDILRTIDAWRQGAPVFAVPRSLYEMPAWYDLLQARERLHAVRKAMDLAPKHDDGGGGLPARHLLALCLDAATKTIRLYGRLFHSHVVTYTRSYFHTVFTAGLSVMMCCCASVPPRASLPDTLPSIRDARAVLRLCQQTLAHMGEQLPDARPYVTAFEALHTSVSLRLDQALAAAATDDDDVPAEGSRDGDGEAPTPRHAHPLSLDAAFPGTPNTVPATPAATPTAAGGGGLATTPAAASLDAQLTHAAQLAMPLQHFQQHPHQPPHAHHPHQHIHPAVTMDSLGLAPSPDAGVASFYGRSAGLAGPAPFGADVVAPHAGFGAPFGVPATPVRNDLLQWAFLSDDTMWNVVGEYVYGDPNETLELFSGFDFGTL